MSVYCFIVWMSPFCFDDRRWMHIIVYRSRCATDVAFVWKLTFMLFAKWNSQIQWIPAKWCRSIFINNTFLCFSAVCLLFYFHFALFVCRRQMVWNGGISDWYVFFFLMLLFMAKPNCCCRRHSVLSKYDNDDGITNISVSFHLIVNSLFFAFVNTIIWIAGIHSKMLCWKINTVTVGVCDVQMSEWVNRLKMNGAKIRKIILCVFFCLFP